MKTFVLFIGLMVVTLGVILTGDADTNNKNATANVLVDPPFDW